MGMAEEADGEDGEGGLDDFSVFPLNFEAPSLT